MNGEELLTTLRDEHVLGAVKSRLGLPDDATAIVLRDIQGSQAHMDRRIDRLADAVLELTDAQKVIAIAQHRTEVRVGELAEAQRRTEARVGELTEGQKKLTEAQRRTETRLEELIVHSECFEARTEDNFRSLREDFRSLRQEVGALSRTIGSWIEELVEALLAEWLHREHHVQVELQRGFHIAELGDEEIDGYGEGIGPDGPLLVVAEVKSTVRKREVEAFRAKLERVKGVPSLPVLGVLLGRAIHPAAREEALCVGLLLVSEKVLRGT